MVESSRTHQMLHLSPVIDEVILEVKHAQVAPRRGL